MEEWGKRHLNNADSSRSGTQGLGNGRFSRVCFSRIGVFLSLFFFFFSFDV